MCWLHYFCDLTAERLFFLFALILYFSGIISLSLKKFRFSVLSEYFFLSGFLLHFFSCVLCPFKNINMHQALSFLSLSLLLVYFLLKFIRKTSAGQPFFFILSFLLSILSIFVPTSQAEVKNFSSVFFITHIILTISGIGGLFSALIYSFIYFIQEERLRKKKVPYLETIFPSLEKSNILSFKSLRDGYILYTIGIFMGYFWSYKNKGVLTNFSLKETFAFISWIFFGALYFIQKKYGWRGKRVLFMYLIGLISILLAIAGIRIF